MLFTILTEQSWLTPLPHTLIHPFPGLFSYQQKEFAAACVDHLPRVPLAGPLEATLLFYFKRPKNQYGTGKNAHILKPAVVAAGLWHSKRKGEAVLLLVRMFGCGCCCCCCCCHGYCRGCCWSIASFSQPVVFVSVLVIHKYPMNTTSAMDATKTY